MAKKKKAIETENVVEEIVELKEIKVSGVTHKVVKVLENGSYLCEDGCTYKL